MRAWTRVPKRTPNHWQERGTRQRVFRFECMYLHIQCLCCCAVLSVCIFHEVCARKLDAMHVHVQSSAFLSGPEQDMRRIGDCVCVWGTRNFRAQTQHSHECDIFHATPADPAPFQTKPFAIRHRISRLLGGVESTKYSIVQYDAGIFCCWFWCSGVVTGTGSDTSSVSGIMGSGFRCVCVFIGCFFSVCGV